MKQFLLKIFRGTPGKQHWEEFELNHKPFYNVISALMDVQKNPINRKGEKVAPITWEQGCLEEVCGSCSMLINGRPRQACTALIDTLTTQSGSQVVVLAPFTKFPLIRDLVVDRQSMFDNLKKISAWINVDDTYDRGWGPKMSQDVQEIRYVLSTCMTCGCCSEACPQVSARSDFMGPAPISQVRLFNSHPTGKLEAPKRLRTLMQKDGIASCGNAQNCAKVCPKNIPLTESIAVMGREVSKQAMRDLISLPDAYMQST
jgi:succinate dehydrogenase / fumarate reductase iron-sulfur subunit